jgi:hypothetical protein
MEECVKLSKSLLKKAILYYWHHVVQAFDLFKSYEDEEISSKVCIRRRRSKRRLLET